MTFLLWTGPGDLHKILISAIQVVDTQFSFQEMIVKMKTRNLACLIAVTDNIKLYTYESTYK